MTITDANGIERLSKDNGRFQVEVDTTSRDHISYNESTHDPIFLFQKRVINGINPNSLSEDEYHHDGETLWIDVERFCVEEISKASREDRMLRKKDCEDLPFEIGISISDNEMVDNDWAIFHWETVRVFRSREEGVEYGVSQTHNYGKFGEGWRVYCIPCEGELATILKHVDRKQLIDFIKSGEYQQALSAFIVRKG